MLLTIQRNEPGVIDRLPESRELLEAHRHGRVDQHAEHTEDEAHDHRPPAALGVEPLEEHAEEEDDEDRRGQVALNLLQVLVEAVGSLDDGDPRQGDQHHDDRGDAARADDLAAGVALGLHFS